MQERTEVEDELNRQREEDEARIVKDRLYKARHQSDVLGQVAEKERQQRRGYQEAMFEKQAQRLAEREYRGKIDREWAKNEEALARLKGLR